MTKKIFNPAMISFVLFILFSYVFLGGTCNNNASIVKGDSSYSGVFSKVNNPWVEKTLSQMTLEEKAAQVIFPRISGKYFSWDALEFQKALHEVKDLKVGGIILGTGDVYESAFIINKLQKESKIPLLISSDFERGLAFRIDGTTSFPSNMAVGAANDSLLTYQMGKIISIEGEAIGIQQNYAPVSDVNTNPNNPIINVRSFSDNVNLVKKLSVAVIKGMQDGDMIATAKHFPGHGNTSVDSHRRLPTIPGTKKELFKVELPPFESDIKNGVMSIMVGHLHVPAFESRDIPATLSKNIVTDLLKKKLGFNGLVVTDAMGMHAITNSYNTDQAVIKALNAGNDVILLPHNTGEAIKAIVDAVKKGEISDKRLNDAVTKILIAKKWAGLDKNRFVDISKIPFKVATNSHWEIANKLARKSITLVKDENNLIPLSSDTRIKYASISILDNDQAGVEKLFNSTLSQETNNLRTVTVLENSNRSIYRSALRAAKRSDIILLSVYTKIRAYSGKIGLNRSEPKLVRDILSLKKPVVLLSHGNPYILSTFPGAKTYLCNYGENNLSEIALADALFGEIPIQGKLPINIPKTKAKFSTGIELPQSALRPISRFKLVEENKNFQGVDSVINAAIRDSAFPGAELLVAQNGVILHFKAYGHYTYNDTSGVISRNTMYDLASLTKVIATTTATMICYDRGLFKLDDKVAKYIPQFGVNGKENVTIRNLLVHDSGLRPDITRKLASFDTVKNKPQAVLNEIYNDSLVYRTGSKMVYSDLNMIVMGKIIEKVTGERLDQFTEKEIFEPLGMSSTMFNPPKSLIYKIAPTEYDNYWRHRQIRGTVHDETAALLGGVAGHAGLFSDASDLAKLLQMLLQKGVYQGRRFIKASTVNLFIKKQSNLSTRALGWDTKSPKRSSAGHFFSNLSYGHLGFPGTSVWTDPTRKLFVVFLTNRVYPTRKDIKIRAVRPVVHDAVIKAIEK